MEIPDDRLPLLIIALEQYIAYMRATRRDERPYRELAELIQRKPPASETEKQPRAKRKA